MDIDQNITPSVAEETQPPPVSKVPFGSWWKVGVLVVGVLLAVSIFYAGYQYSQKQTSLVAYPTGVPTPTPTDETANWKTYTNPDGFYTLKYPVTLIYREKNISNSTCKTELILANKDIGFIEKYQGDIVIDVCPMAKEFFPRAAFGNIVGNGTQSITVGGKQGYMKVGEVTSEKLGSKFKVKRLVFYENNMEYAFDLRYIPGNPNIDFVFDQILSTFQFD